jgi:hypothetical protein
MTFGGFPVTCDATGGAVPKGSERSPCDYRAPSNPGRHPLRPRAHLLAPPCGFVAGLFDEGDSPIFIADLHYSQQQVEFGEPDGQFLAVFEDPAVDVGVGLGADVAAGEQVLQGPAGAVGEFGDVAVEAWPALDARTGLWSTRGREEKSMPASSFWSVTCWLRRGW